MIVIYVRAIDPAALLQSSEPVELAWRTQVLQDRKHCHPSTVDDDCGCYSAKLTGAGQRLCDQEADEPVGEVKEQSGGSRMPVCREPKR